MTINLLSACCERVRADSGDSILCKEEASWLSLLCATKKANESEHENRRFPGGGGGGGNLQWASCGVSI